MNPDDLETLRDYIAPDAYEQDEALNRIEAEVERLNAENIALAATQCMAPYAHGSGSMGCRKLDNLRARLDHYEQGRCCVEEPPEVGCLAYVTGVALSTRFLLKYDGYSWVDQYGVQVPDVGRGWRWYPLPGGRDG